MMKIIGGVIVVVLIAIALWMWQGKKSDMAPVGMSGDKQTEGVTGALEQGKEVIASIQDAMKLGAEMQCDFTSGDGESAVTSTVYVSGQKFFTTATAGGVKTNALFDGSTQYVWTEGSTQGMKLTKACLESMKSQPNTRAEAQSRDYQKEFEMAQNVQCEPKANATVSFTVPTEITFSDQCAMMQESLKMMEQVKSSLPAGVAIPTVPLMAQ